MRDEVTSSVVEVLMSVHKIVESEGDDAKEVFDLNVVNMV